MEIPLGHRLRELPGPVLLTGHTGFKGSWLTLLLRYLKIPVIGYSLPSEKESLFERANLTGAIPEKLADIRDYPPLENFIDEHRPSAILHMAAQPLVLESYRNPRETFDVNVMGTVNILDVASIKNFIEAVIIVTTDKVYRNNNAGKAFLESDPLEGKDPYSASKVGAESAVAAWQQMKKINKGPNVLAVRAGNVIGGGDFSKDRIVPDLIRGYLSQKEVILRNPNSTRPWQHVLDPLTGYLMALELLIDRPLPNALNFGPEESSISVLEMTQIARKIIEIKMSNSPYEKDDVYEAKSLNLDSSLAGSALSWSPLWNQEEAVRKTFEWWKCVLDFSISAEAACNSDIEKFLSGLMEKI